LRRLAGPIHCLLTKSDKLTRQEQAKTLRETRNALAERGGQISVQMFSSLKKTGVDEADASDCQLVGQEKVVSGVLSHSAGPGKPFRKGGLGL
jgi:GTP-binding protein EngB required for normal cell division